MRCGASLLKPWGGAMGIRKTVTLCASIAFALFTLIGLSACVGGGTYQIYLPNASAGRLSHPQMRSGSWWPKSWIIFTSPASEKVIDVAVYAGCKFDGTPKKLTIGISKIYSSSSTFRKLPYPDNMKFLASDRWDISASSRSIEIIWGSGRHQVIPLDFPEQRGENFSIYETAQMDIPLEGPANEPFDVNIPILTIDGHKLEIPTIHFASEPAPHVWGITY